MFVCTYCVYLYRHMNDVICFNVKGKEFFVPFLFSEYPICTSFVKRNLYWKRFNTQFSSDDIIGIAFFPNHLKSRVLIWAEGWPCVRGSI